MSRTFTVDDVELMLAPLPRAADVELAARIGGEALAQSSDAGDVVDVSDVHPLIHAVHRAFAEHRPLLLTPDAVWLTIAQGFAIHVCENAAKLRPRFVRHEDRKKLQVAAMGLDAAAWEGAFEGFADEIVKEMGAGIVNLLTCSFSTTTPAARAASRVVLMDAFQKYFDYEIMCICGIPRITLAGTVEDWREMRKRVDVLAEYELSWWTEKLIPVLDKFVETASGADVDVDFWQCIYKPAEAYGGEVMTGWLVRLFPYLDYPGGMHKNEMEPLGDNDGFFRSVKRKVTGEKRSPWLHQGFKPPGAPKGLSKVPVRVVGEREQLCVAVAGLVGVAQDSEGNLNPRIGWAVRAAPDDELHERIAATATSTTPPAGRHYGAEPVPKVLVAFYDRFGSAVIDDVHIWTAAALKFEQLGDEYGASFADVGADRLVYVRGRGGLLPVYRVRADGTKTKVADTVLELLDRLTRDVAERKKTTQTSRAVVDER